MNVEEANKLSLDRLFNLQMIQLKTLEHYIMRDDLYNKEDSFGILKDLVIINSVIKIKLKKTKILKYEKTK